MIVIMMRVMATTTLLSAHCIPDSFADILLNVHSNPTDAALSATWLYCFQILPVVGVNFTHHSKLNTVPFENWNYVF